MKLFTPRHKHLWKVKEKEILPSEAEQWLNGGGNYNGPTLDSFKPMIVHYFCDCGAEEVKRV